jgi:hypothetical protein
MRCSNSAIRFVHDGGRHSWYGSQQRAKYKVLNCGALACDEGGAKRAMH